MRTMKNSLMLLAALALAGCAEMETRPNAATPGSTYVNAVRNTGSYGNVNAEQRTRVVGERMLQGRKVFVYENVTTGLNVVTDGDTGRWIGFFKGDTPLQTWEPPIGYNHPLTVGASWSRTHRFTDHVKKVNTEFTGTWKVEALEDVTVRAGTFRAYKVVYSDTVGNEQMQWLSPELGIFVKQSNRRGAKHRLGAGTNDVELVSRPAMP